MRAVGDLVEQLLADRAVDHLLHVRGVAEQEGQVEHVEVVDHRAERADADARELDGADLRLLDRFLLAAELHGGIHLHVSRPLVACSSFLPMFSTATTVG